MKIIDRMKTFAVGETITANMTAQGMLEGYDYTVVTVIDKTTAAGVFFDYEIQAPAGKILYIVNGHILFDPR
jgi:hypothetical protein